MATTTSIGICIATCRRPKLLRRTLQSLAAQQLDAAPGATAVPDVRVWVCDNDLQQHGLQVVRELQAGYRWPLFELFEPQPGISFARNRGVAAAAECTWLAFIDDDERAAPQWLSQLLATAARTRADAVLGPVEPEFAVPVPGWLRPAFEPEPLDPRAPVPPGRFRTSNLLVRTASLRRIEPPFHPDFALTGGSDSLLGEQLARCGARFAWAPDALVFETVTAERLSLTRYLLRRYRCGMTFTMQRQLLDGTVHGALRGLYRGAGSLVAAPLLALRSTWTGKSPLPAVGLLAYGAGSIVGVTGHRYEEYRRSPAIEW